MKKPAYFFLVLLFMTSIAMGQNRAQSVYESMVQAFDPVLLRQAEDRGLYDREAYPVLRAMNPFFLRGDFNGDGEQDLAFWVQNRKTNQRGVAIVHSTLEQLFMFGAGKPRPAPLAEAASEIRVDAWHLVPAGDIESHPYTDIPEVGVVSGQPFTFKRETLEFIHLGKSAFVFYWAKGQYWEFWTAD